MPFPQISGPWCPPKFRSCKYKWLHSNLNACFLCTQNPTAQRKGRREYLMGVAFQLCRIKFHSCSPTEWVGVTLLNCTFRSSQDNKPSMWFSMQFKKKIPKKCVLWVSFYTNYYYKHFRHSERINAFRP